MQEYAASNGNRCENMSIYTYAPTQPNPSPPRQ